MRRLSVVASPALALLATPAIGQEPAAPGHSITVTDNPMQDYRDHLAACPARHCPVNEECRFCGSVFQWLGRRVKLRGFWRTSCVPLC